MFKITCFAPVQPDKLLESLKGMHFKPGKNKVEWTLDGKFFRIEPFQNQPRDSMKAYRIYFDCHYSVGLYLFDLVFGCYPNMVTGIEYILEHPNLNSAEWIKTIRQKPSYQMLDIRGIFTKKDCGVIVINDTVVLQFRSPKNKKLNVLDCMKKIDSIREELTPSIEYDLFSLPEEIA